MILFQTERLNIRPLTREDDAFTLQLINEPSYIANIVDRGVRTLEGAVEYLENKPLAGYALHGHDLWCVTRKEADHIPIGMAGVLKRDTLEYPDLGYAFLPDYWGQGYALEANAGVMKYAREVLNLGTILAIVSPKNGPSINLLKKLGFTFEKMYRADYDVHDVEMYIHHPPA